MYLLHPNFTKLPEKSDDPTLKKRCYREGAGRVELTGTLGEPGAQKQW